MCSVCICACIVGYCLYVVLLEREGLCVIRYEVCVCVCVCKCVCVCVKVFYTYCTYVCTYTYNMHLYLLCVHTYDIICVSASF